MVEKKIDEKEVEELKKTHNHYLDKRREFMKSTQFKLEDIFGDNITKKNLVNKKKLNLKVFSPK